MDKKIFNCFDCNIKIDLDSILNKKIYDDPYYNICETCCFFEGKIIYYCPACSSCTKCCYCEKYTCAKHYNDGHCYICDNKINIVEEYCNLKQKIDNIIKLISD